VASPDADQRALDDFFEVDLGQFGDRDQTTVDLTYQVHRPL
jgi:hypothetical protein